MPLLKNLEDQFREHGVQYDVTTHAEVYTAQEVAASQHVPGRMMVKVVMLKVEGKIVMMVISANCKIDMKKVKRLMGSENVELASEAEFKDLFPECEVGAMPPFGNFYDIPMYVDQHLAENEKIVFNAGNHFETVAMKYEDYARVANPMTADVCCTDA